MDNRLKPRTPAQGTWVPYYSDDEDYVCMALLDENGAVLSYRPVTEAEYKELFCLEK